MPLAQPLQQVDRTYVLHRGRRLSYFGGCDYFRLGSHPAVLRALRNTLDREGLNVAASRSTTGNHALFGSLESAVARFFKAEAAVLVASGYATNLVVAQALRGEFTHAFVDERSHASLLDGLPYLGCKTITFRHRDPVDVAEKARRLGANSTVLLLTDGMFSHDGSVAPLREYRQVLGPNGLMLVDDAHGAGVLGAQGRGSIEACAVSRRRLIQTISLSKAFGVYGGVVLCSREQRDLIIARSRLFSGNTPLALPLAKAAIESVSLLRRHPEWRTRMNAHAARVKAALRSKGWDVPNHPGPIISIVPTDAAHVGVIERRLLKAKVFSSLIRYPGGPAGGYFRFMISSEHKPEQLDALTAGLGEVAWVASC